MNKIEVVIHPQYRKGYRNLERKHRKHTIETLDTVVDLLSENKEVPAKYKPHKLSGVNQFECHIETDVLLVWRYENNNLILELHLLDITNHDSLNRKSKIHGCDSDSYIYPEETDDWSIRWNRKFGDVAGKSYTVEAFKQLCKEMDDFE